MFFGYASFTFQNLLSHRAAEHPDESTRVYTIPYIIDTVPTFYNSNTSSGSTTAKTAGIRLHWPITQASTGNIQMVYDYKNGLSLGSTDASLSGDYVVQNTPNLSPLGVSLEWNSTTTNTKANS